jgi:hypothetical protein
MSPPAYQRAEKIRFWAQFTPHVAPLNAAHDGAARHPYQQPEGLPEISPGLNPLQRVIPREKG